jgi:hypothetical protein
LLVAILSAFRRQAAALVLWTGIALLAKPLAVVVVLLVAGLRPRTIPALAGGIGWAIALPFAAADPHYVLGLYKDCWQMFTTMAMSSHFTAADFTALFQGFGWSIEPVQILLIRCFAAFATWMAAIVLCARLPRNAAALAVMVLAASYMCLFNPRAEGVTYAILAALRDHHCPLLLRWARATVMGRGRRHLGAASGLRLTFESWMGFPADWMHANLAHVYRNFHHTQAR